MDYTYTARNKKETHVTLEDSGIRVRIWTRKNGERHYFYPYRDITRIHLSMPDTAWYTIKIWFVDRRRILLRSLTFGKRSGDRIIGERVQQAKEYSAFVSTLHQKLIDQQLHGNILFKQGHLWMALLCLGTAALCAFAFVPMTWYTRSYMLLLTFLLAVPTMLLFAFKLGYVRTYLPTHVPQKYLPIEEISSS